MALAGHMPFGLEVPACQELEIPTNAPFLQEQYALASVASEQPKDPRNEVAYYNWRSYRDGILEEEVESADLSIQSLKH